MIAGFSSLLLWKFIKGLLDVRNCIFSRCRWYRADAAYGEGMLISRCLGEQQHRWMSAPLIPFLSLCHSFPAITFGPKDLKQISLGDQKAQRLTVFNWIILQFSICVLFISGKSHPVRPAAYLLSSLKNEMNLFGALCIHQAPDLIAPIHLAAQ